MDKKYYVGAYSEEKIVKQSSSGGAFSAITDIWLLEHENAAIYGCVLNENLNAVHIRGVNKDERDKMRGSKYIASDMLEAYEKIEKDLKADIFVCFTGTPCQVVALKNYLNIRKINYGNKLITVEIICHGVASTRFFKDYITYMEKKYKGKAILCKFRAKSKPGKKQDMQVFFENGKKYTAASTNYDWFYSAYLKNLVIRPSCFQCKFACNQRNADITIADFWSSKLLNEKDESLLISNTDKGEILLNKCKKIMKLRNVEREEFNLPNLDSPTKKPNQYEEFWNIYMAEGYMAVQTYLGNNTVKGHIKSACVIIVDCLNLKKYVRMLKH